jgi:chaperonin cofactor prefoldin
MNSKTLLALVMSITFATAYAQSEEQVLNSDPIDVDGYLKEQNVTDHELEQIRSEIRKQKGEVHLNKEKTKGFKELSKTTEKLSETTEEYLDEKKDAQKEISEYNQKIKCLMEENPGPDCAKYVKNAREEAPVVQQVSVAAAAPVVSTAEIAPVEGPLKPFEQLKLSLNGGVINYSGDTESLRADTMGLRAESNITDRFSMNIGVNYTTFQTEDFANNYYGNQDWSSNYYGFYGAKGRDIEYKNYGVDIGGKFFVARTERFRPYVGVNLGYNMANLRYMKNDGLNMSNMGYGYQFGDEEFKTNFANLGVSIGTEILFTRTVGMTLQGAYSRGMGSSLSSDSSKNPTNSPDQKRLTELGDEVINANALSITAGLMVIF